MKKHTGLLKTQILEPGHTLALKAQDPEFGPQKKMWKKKKTKQM